MTDQQTHSPLGGSGMYRWVPCPGSVRMSQGVEDPESEYAAEGTAAHALAEHCLTTGTEAWQYIGREGYDGFKPTKEMADAVQEYLDDVRREHPDRNQGNTWIEKAFHCPEVHPWMYGRSDLVHLEEMPALIEDANGTPVPCDYIGGGRYRLHVWDYKHGAGIVVDVQENPQLMYYAVGIMWELDLWDSVDEVVLHIHQPRGWMDSHRTWTIPTDALMTWAEDVLQPAMRLAEKVMIGDHDGDVMDFLSAGEHCRFCPARYRACPRLVADMQDMEELMNEIEAAGGAPKATNEQVGRFLTFHETAKILAKAMREVGFSRAQGGVEVPGWKLVRAKSNREWKDEAEARLVEELGEDRAYDRKLKSPAQVEKLAKGKALAAELAFKPEAGLQLVPDHDKRQEAGPKVRSMFKPANKRSK